MTAAQIAMTELGTWPDLVSGPPRCAVGHAFGAAGHDLVHFHSDDCADLYLTSSAVQRLLPQLRRASAIRVHPGASWITVLLECDTDVHLLLSLVSVALKEHGEHACPSPPCDWERPRAS
ncbi:hypothetical protein GTW43_31710 [Streptomyces sp. SID5785]|uniref:luciferase domain-containing protein n=1 Tax=Streptomyces sp. SID5785 TaxID=2690309 RepID=UPI001361AB32|nr:luciferase family protein [Streptomyces sp. SID5785]MZD09612.1 hypothetical protein [Streptomyces sp. SID5785]